MHCATHLPCFGHSLDLTIFNIMKDESRVTPASLILQGYHLECFKYLGLLQTFPVVESICSRVRKLLRPLHVHINMLATDPTSAVHIDLPGGSTPRICQSSMESLPAEKYKHTRGCSEICPQNVFQVLGSGLLQTAPVISHSYFISTQTPPRLLHYV